MSVFDPQPLAKLAADMQDPRFARTFAEKYRSLLEHRVTRIIAALRDSDLIEAMDAVLSLKVASTSVGTSELAELALMIEREVRAQDAAAARTRASLLPDAARRADAALTAHLSR
ncbi:hypothetical protein [Nocardioides dongkuii]|uniref:hypothetical protein n=1 Tax=Nocardioides dongkuii TaxID=2760089 RepID=UPI0015FE27A6|nr:hypothetical protein [Nocardioides dongkuii]